MTDRAKDQLKDLMPGLFFIPAILSRSIIFMIRSRTEPSVFIKRAAHTKCDLKGLGISQQADPIGNIHRDTARAEQTWLFLHCLPKSEMDGNALLARFIPNSG